MNLIDHISKHEAQSLEDFAEECGFTLLELRNYINDKESTASIESLAKARALLSLSPVVNRLISIINGEDDKAAISAAALLFKISGMQKPAKFTLSLSFDEMMNRRNESAGPLDGLTKIIPKQLER